MAGTCAGEVHPAVLFQGHTWIALLRGLHVLLVDDIGHSFPKPQNLNPCGVARLQMLLVDNMVHSDLHPGNILVRLDPPRGSRTLAHFITHRLGLEVRGFRCSV